MVYSATYVSILVGLALLARQVRALWLSEFTRFSPSPEIFTCQRATNLIKGVVFKILFNWLRMVHAFCLYLRS